MILMSVRALILNFLTLCAQADSAEEKQSSKSVASNNKAKSKNITTTWNQVLILTNHNFEVKVEPPNCGLQGFDQ